MSDIWFVAAIALSFLAVLITVVVNVYSFYRSTPPKPVSYIYICQVENCGYRIESNFPDGFDFIMRLHEQTHRED